MRQKNTAERGTFKREISTALFNSAEIRELLCGDLGGKSISEQREIFRKHVKSHLFIDDTVEDTDTFIFYDVRMPMLRTNTKSCSVILYAVCHRDILDCCAVDGYDGNRADILSQMVEDCLLNNEETARSFGIGTLTLDSVDIYNSRRFYGVIMQFSVPNFR